MRDLVFSDWPMFAKVMEDDDICKEFIEVVTGIEVAELVHCEPEKTLVPEPFAKPVRLDVFAKGSGKLFDIEMQARMLPALGRRLRYYQSAMDSMNVSPGTAYEELPDSYIIFLCKSDPFGKGVPVYTFCEKAAEAPGLDLGCGMTWIVLNASAWQAVSSRRLRCLLEYVGESQRSDDALVKSIESKVQAANSNLRWKEEAMGFMTIEHDQRARMNAARKEGLQEGLREGIAEGENRFGRLAAALLDDGRVDDLKKASQDPEYRDELFREFEI